MTDANGDISDSRTKDDYDLTGGSETDDDIFCKEDRPSASYSNVSNYTAPGDPGTNYESSDVAGTNSDNADNGTLDETNGKVTDETDNFDDKTNSTDVYSLQANSDVGSAGNMAGASVPWIIPGVLGSFYTGKPIGGQWSPIPYDYRAPATWTTTSNAKVSSDDTEFGTSYGADKAIEVANEIAALLQTKDYQDLRTKVRLNLSTSDAIARGTVDPNTGLYKGSKASQRKLSDQAQAILGIWHNYFQTKDTGFGVLPPLRGRSNFPAPATNDLLDDFFPNASSKDKNKNGVHAGLLSNDDVVEQMLDDLITD